MNRNIRFLILLPCVVVIVLFLMLPLLNSLLPTFFEGGSLDFTKYSDFLFDSYNRTILFRTINLSLIVTLICMVLGLPTAYYISGVSKRRRGILIALTMFPLLTNSVIRSFAWINILGKNGVINKILLGLHIIDQPLTLLYTEFAIVVGSVYLFLPTMIMTLVGVLENIDDDLLEAASTLGASPLQGITKIILPLAIPGMIVGGILVFTGTLTAYTTPQLLGGNKKMMLATLLYQQASALGDWTRASIIAFIMIVVTVLVMKSFNYLAKRLDRGGVRA